MNTFEQSLLTELREHVAARAPRRSRRWRWAAVPVAALAAGATVFAMQPNPAYAVSDSGEEVVIIVKRLDDADGLEKALAEHGIEAEVDYSGNDTASVDADAPADEAVQPEPMESELSVGSEEAGESTDAWGTVDDDGTFTEHEGEPESGDVPESGLAFSSAADGSLQLTIDRDTIPAGQVLQIVTSGTTSSAGLAVWWGESTD